MTSSTLFLSDSPVHMGKTNKKCDYNLGNSLLKVSRQERDLGVLINCNGKQFKQCSAAVNKANAVLGMIKSNVVFKSKDNIYYS
jgi:hypothetical protein